MHSQSQLLLPLLDVLQGAPTGLSAKAACDAVAAHIGLEAKARAARIQVGDQQYNAFDRDVRWVRQRAIAAGLVESPARGTWMLTGRGKKALRVARPGLVITVYESDDGRVLWGGIEDAVGEIEDGSIQLLMTSPPYPLQRKKDYGNLDSQRHVEWLARVMSLLLPKLKANGSVVLNLGDVYQPGQPTLDPYAERLLIKLIDELKLNLAGRFEWQNPSKMPAPAEWCTVRRVRVKSSLERCYWLSPSAHPKADNRQVLVPYSARMTSLIAKGGEAGATRPSGYQLDAGGFARDNGGAIPGNLIVAANTESNGRYMRFCRDQELPIHPARYPSALPDFFIRMLTEPGDLVADSFAGSLKTGQVARSLGRQFLCIERVLEYVIGGIGGRLSKVQPLPA